MKDLANEISLWERQINTQQNTLVLQLKEWVRHKLKKKTDTEDLTNKMKGKANARD